MNQGVHRSISWSAVTVRGEPVLRKSVQKTPPWVCAPPHEELGDHNETAVATNE